MLYFHPLSFPNFTPCHVTFSPLSCPILTPVMLYCHPCVMSHCHPCHVAFSPLSLCQPAGTEEESRREQLLRGRFEVERVRQGSKGELPAYATFKGVRSLKHKYDKNHQEGMRKSSSLHDLSSQDKDMAASLAASRFLSCSGDRLDVLAGGGGVMGGGKSPGAFSTNPYFTIPRTSWPSRVHPSSPQLTAPAAHPSLFNSSSSLSSSTSSTNSATRRGSFDDRPLATHKPLPGRERSRHSRERSTSLKDFPSQLTLLPRESGGGGEGGERRAGSVGSALRPEADDLSQSMSADETDSNETDELKVSGGGCRGWLVSSLRHAVPFFVSHLSSVHVVGGSPKFVYWVKVLSSCIVWKSSVHVFCGNPQFMYWVEALSSCTVYKILNSCTVWKSSVHILCVNDTAK